MKYKNIKVILMLFIGVEVIIMLNLSFKDEEANIEVFNEENIDIDSNYLLRKEPIEVFEDMKDNYLDLKSYKVEEDYNLVEVDLGESFEEINKNLDTINRLNEYKINSYEILINGNTIKGSITLKN